MKHILLLITLAIGSFSFIPITDDEGVIKALKAGDAEQLSSYFDSFIDLKLPEKEEVKNMGKNQAGIAIKTFFTENGIKGFDLTSQREIGGTMYLAGKLKNAGKGFNITIMMKKSNDNHGITTIRIN
jgi:Domain of unknown function (DUF4783)